LFGDTEPSRAKRERSPSSTPVGVDGGSELSYAVTTPSGGLSAKQNQFTYVLQPDDKQGGQGALKALPTDIAPSLTATENERSTDRGVRITAFAQNQRDELREMDQAGALAAEPGMKQQTYISNGHTSIRRLTPLDTSIRRLTPLECERLQGFPDHWTDIPKNSTTQRYRQLGNAVAVPVAQWIMERLDG
jgi:site-specific DNA-cytosine methylase